MVSLSTKQKVQGTKHKPNTRPLLMTEKWEKLSLGWILVRKWLVITGQREFILKLSQNGRQSAPFFKELYFINELLCFFFLTDTSGPNTWPTSSISNFKNYIKPYATLPSPLPDSKTSYSNTFHRTKDEALFLGNHATMWLVVCTSCA